MGQIADDVADGAKCVPHASLPLPRPALRGR